MNDKMTCIEVELPVGLEDIGGPVTGLLEWAQKIVDCVPPEFRATSRVVYMADDGRGWLELWYERPETDADREEGERRKGEHEAAQARRDRAEYERLRAKFEAPQ